MRNTDIGCLLGYIVYFLWFCVLGRWRYAFTFRSFDFSILWWNLCFCIPNCLGPVISVGHLGCFEVFFWWILWKNRNFFQFVCLVSIFQWPLIDLYTFSFYEYAWRGINIEFYFYANIKRSSFVSLVTSCILIITLLLFKFSFVP